MSSASILAAVHRASHDRLARFVTFCDPNMPAWKGDPATWTVAMLRAEAFVLADRFYAMRRTNRFWRNYPVQHHAPPKGHSVVPSYAGAALDAWLRGSTPIVAVIEDRDTPAFQIAAE